jgi:hypothetical protein
MPTESVEAVYKGFKEGVDSYGETIYYTLEIEGQTKNWNCKNVSVARQFDSIGEGTKILITRSARDEKNRTTYKIEKI